MKTIRGKSRLFIAYLKQELLQVWQVLISILTLKEIVIVHQMGKVGSTSILVAVNDTSKFYGLQTHRLSDEIRNERRALSRASGGAMKYANFLSHYVSRRKERFPKVVMAVRDPVSRYVSDFFHNIEAYTRSEKSCDQLIKLFLEEYNFGYFDYWFRHELELYYGLGIEDFDYFSWGGRSKKGKVDIIILKSECDNNSKENILSEYLGDNCSVDRENVLDLGDKAALYSEFKNNISFSESLLNDIYSQEWVNAFYSSSEIDSFKKKWMRASA